MNKKEVIKHQIEVCKRNADMLYKLIEILENVFPLDKESYHDLSFENRVNIDAFLHRIAKLQDSLGKLIKFYLDYEGIETGQLTPRDIFNIAEKYGIINSVESWFSLRDLRNSIAHDYSLLDTEVINILNRTFELSKELLDNFDRVYKIITLNIKE
ncbi:MAG: nucleotidyltransferase substrate binding protein [Hydrogenothermaceae bacterium]|nr:nucleotidyltransferase substrate binding protein [Hydrogenothermaceae bacterium]